MQAEAESGESGGFAVMVVSAADAVGRLWSRWWMLRELDAVILPDMLADRNVVCVVVACE
jgi:hypothetical protein